jgi:hypothetical protein
VGCYIVWLVNVSIRFIANFTGITVIRGGLCDFFTKVGLIFSVLLQ